MTSYDFRNLQLTGKFEKRPDTGRILMGFSVRGHNSYGRRPAIVYDNIGRCTARQRTTSYGDLTKADSDTYIRMPWLMHLTQIFVFNFLS